MSNRILHALIVTGIVAVGGFLSWKLWPREPSADAPLESTVDQETSLVVLTPQELESVAIEIATAVESPIQPTRTIAGRLDYDQDRHVAVKSACEGILTDIRVRPGDQVMSGQVVAVVSSPELGRVRSTVYTRLGELKLADSVRMAKEPLRWRGRTRDFDSRGQVACRDR